MFGGDSNREQGLRVLSQISEFCSPAPSVNNIEGNTLVFHEGMRMVFGYIMRCMAIRAEVKIEKEPTDE